MPKVLFSLCQVAFAETPYFFSTHTSASSMSPPHQSCVPLSSDSAYSQSHSVAPIHPSGLGFRIYDSRLHDSKVGLLAADNRVWIALFQPIAHQRGFMTLIAQGVFSVAIRR
ncbi:uncharacterized protein BDZ99DRAFT_170896 [Mytilinidion resinicola]|uniref:Uncharacterized protein n=1 Tax=Mytilinidion resinicola TaxID=574789 RepID=A0A6A6Y3V2_9PEZI|nr:uncharacterized protein BDZ99DRAFT_170896 [Mytilinidion resinicola]KAF2803330.1 hypothetical protein BDZ99DRAFT_170896 [Mytilinidion resinicola]